MCSTPLQNISNVQYTTSQYFERAAHYLEIFWTRSTPSQNISNTQHTTLKYFQHSTPSKCLEHAAHHLEIFSDQVRECVPNDPSFAGTWGITLYHCRGRATVQSYRMGCTWVFRRGRLMNHCRGHCPSHCRGLSGRPYTCGYLRAAYFRNIYPACWLRALHTLERTWCGWRRKLWKWYLLWQTQQPYCLYLHFKPFTAVEISATASLCQNMWVRAIHMLWLSTRWPGITIYGALLLRVHNVDIIISYWWRYRWNTCEHSGLSAVST